MKESDSKLFDSNEKYRSILNEILRDLESISVGPAVQSKTIKDLISKYRIYIASVDEEINQKTKRLLEYSNSYIINTEKYSERMVYSLIEKSIGKYYSSGLFIIKENPETFYLRKMLELKSSIRTRFIWLTNINTTYEKVSPSNLLQLQKLIMDYIKEIEKQKSMILLEGLEIIKTYNEMREMLKYLKNIKDQISISNSIFLIPFNFSAFTAEEIGLLKGNFNQFP